MKAAQRLFLTANSSALVGEGDPAAAFLYAAIGDEIPQSAVDKFGLVDGGLASKEGEAKDKPSEGDKEKQGGGDKGASTALTTIKGIGDATAAKLVAAGIVDVAALAAIDPATPPAIEGLQSTFDWAASIELAKAAIAPASPVQA